MPIDLSVKIFDQRSLTFYIAFFVLFLAYLSPYAFLGSEQASLIGNQVKIFISILGALVLFTLQRKLFSFGYLIVTVFIYFLQGFYLYLSGFELYFFRSLSLSYIFYSFFALVIFEYKRYIELEIFKRQLSFFILLFFILIVYKFITINDNSLIIRPHSLLILVVTLLSAGVCVGRFNVLLLFIIIMLMSYYSYNSRIAQVLGVLLLFYEFGFKRVIIFFVPVLLVLYFSTDVFVRFSDNGLEDFGRAFIYDCFFTNFNKLNYLLPTYDGLENCYEFDYLHSSILILFVEYGVLLGFILIGLFLFLLIRNLVKSDKDFPSFYIFLIVLLFSLVEGGVEWFFLYISGLFGLNVFSVKNQKLKLVALVKK